ARGGGGRASRGSASRRARARPPRAPRARRGWAWVRALLARAPPEEQGPFAACGSWRRAGERATHTLSRRRPLVCRSWPRWGTLASITERSTDGPSQDLDCRPRPHRRLGPELLPDRRAAGGRPARVDALDERGAD